LIDCLAPRLRVGGHFTKHDHSAVAVLVADEIGTAIAVAFFAAENAE
jgi:hypothetical protein